MSQVEPKSNGRQPVPDLEDLPSLKAYQKLMEATNGFEVVMVEHFFALTPVEREKFVNDVVNVLYDFRYNKLQLSCGTLCPKGRTCVPCAS